MSESNSIETTYQRNEDVVLNIAKVLKVLKDKARDKHRNYAMKKKKEYKERIRKKTDIITCLKKRNNI